MRHQKADKGNGAGQRHRGADTDSHPDDQASLYQFGKNAQVAGFRLAK